MSQYGETGRQERTVCLDMEAFKWYLRKNNLTMAELGRQMGRAPGYIKRAVYYGYMRTETLRPIADALGASMSELIYGNDESDPLTRVMNGPLCNQKGPCFARSENGRCSLLTEIYTGRKCPFQKERRNG